MTYTMLLFSLILLLFINISINIFIYIHVRVHVCVKIHYPVGSMSMCPCVHTTMDGFSNRNPNEMNRRMNGDRPLPKIGESVLSRASTWNLRFSHRCVLFQLLWLAHNIKNKICSVIIIMIITIRYEYTYKYNIYLYHGIHYGAFSFI